MTARRPPVAVAATGASLLLAALSTAFVNALSYDAWGWLIWGQEIAGGHPFTTNGYPTWKPLTALVAVALSPLGHAAPFLWLMVARASAVIALVLAYRLASRLAGRAAGALAALALLIVPDWLFQTGVGGSEPLVTALLLGAVARHADRDDLGAFVLVLLASLLRPESWALLVASAVVAWGRSPRSRPVVALSAMAVPVLWFGGDYLGSGDPFRGSQLAKTTQEAMRLRHLWALPGVGVLHAASRMIPLSLLAAVPAALAWGVRRRDPIVLALGLGSLVWLAEVAALAQLGYAGVTRFLFPAAAGLSVVGAAGLVQVLRAARVNPPAQIALGAVAVALAVPAVINAHSLRRVPQHIEERSDLDGAVSTIVAREGRQTLLAAPHLAAQGQTVTPLAWRLDVAPQSLDKPRFPGLVLADTNQRWRLYRAAIRRGRGRFTRRRVTSTWALTLIAIDRRPPRSSRGSHRPP